MLAASICKHPLLSYLDAATPGSWTVPNTVPWIDSVFFFSWAPANSRFPLVSSVEAGGGPSGGGGVVRGMDGDDDDRRLEEDRRLS